MKQTKRILAVLLAILMLCTAVPFAVQGAEVVDSGYCGGEGDGTNLTWTLDSEGTLTISGEGAMEDWAADSPFCRKESIKSVIIEDSVTTIGDYAFFCVHNLVSVTIPNSVTSIGFAAFDSCISLQNVTIPDSVQILRTQAFAYCPKLNIELGKGVEQIGEVTLAGINNISVDEDNPNFSSENGVLFNKDKTSLLVYPGFNQNAEYFIPDTVESLGDYAFYSAIRLQKVRLPESLKQIGTGVFYGCFSINEFILPCSIETIEQDAFKGAFLPYDITIKSLDVDLKLSFIGKADVKFAGISVEEVREKVKDVYSLDDLEQELMQYAVEPDYENGEEYFCIGTIHCHASSTAEAYAIEHGMDYELTHFFEGDWTYDWDNLIRWRTCIHCDERETELLKKETVGDTEIVSPKDDDRSFDVEPVPENSTKFVLIQEVLGDMNIVQAFDITLKNSDGVHVQPNGTVKVKLPNDFKSGSYKVYRINDDGTYTDMNAYLEGSHLVFFTDHFSLYVIVDESEEQTPDEPSTPSTPEKECKSMFGHLFSIIVSAIELLKVIVDSFRLMCK